MVILLRSPVWHRPLLAIGLLALISGWGGSVGGAPLSQSGPDDPDALVQVARSEELAHRHFARVAKLRTQYLQALLRLEERFAKEGAVNDALTVRDEGRRFREENVSPDPESMPLKRLTVLARIYTTELSRIRIEFRRRFVDALASERELPLAQAATALRD